MLRTCKTDTTNMCVAHLMLMRNSETVHVIFFLYFMTIYNKNVCRDRDGRRSSRTIVVATTLRTTLTTTPPTTRDGNADEIRCDPGTLSSIGVQNYRINGTGGGLKFYTNVLRYQRKPVFKGNIKMWFVSRSSVIFCIVFTRSRFLNLFYN